MYPCSSESNKWRVNRNQSFPINPHLLERWVVEDVDRAPIIHKDLVGVVVPHLKANHGHIVVWVMERLTSSSINPMIGLLIRAIFGMNPIN